VSTNISFPHPEEQISKLLGLIGQPARIQILLVIGAQEACVCHLEAALGMRQASISQHLMALRKAGLVIPNRSGRNIYYRLTEPEVIDVLQHAARLVGMPAETLQVLSLRPIENCPCPQCNPEQDPNLSCQNLHPTEKKPIISS
jgi:DNA-binding transcriptional ArsR family regulator